MIQRNWQAFVYPGLVLAWWLLHGIVRPENGWVYILNRVAHLYFVPLLPLLVWYVVRKQWANGLLLVVPLGIALSFYGDYLRPTAPLTPPDVTVMTYNILYSNKRLDDVAAVILTHDPDLVALQEVGSDAMTKLRLLLGDVYAHSVLGTPISNGVGAQSLTAVFSKTPIDHHENLDPGVRRPMILIETEIAGRPVVFLSAHLYPAWWAWHEPLLQIPAALTDFVEKQQIEVAFLETVVAGYPAVTPIILACDCNTKETTQTYRLLTETWVNSARAAGWVRDVRGDGKWVDRDMRHIDYIMLRGAVAPIATYRIQDNGGSDHLAVLAQLRWEQ